MEADTKGAVAPLSVLRCRMRGRRVYLEIDEHRALSFAVSEYAVLAAASQVELDTIRLHNDGQEIRWADLDEVIRVADVAKSHYVHTAREPE